MLKTSQINRVVIKIDFKVYNNGYFYIIMVFQDIYRNTT